MNASTYNREIRAIFSVAAFFSAAFFASGAYGDETAPPPPAAAAPQADVVPAPAPAVEAQSAPAAAPVVAPAAATAEIKKEVAPENKRPWSVRVDFNQSIGAGAFVGVPTNPVVDAYGTGSASVDPGYGLDFGINGSYDLGPHLKLSLGTGFSGDVNGSNFNDGSTLVYRNGDGQLMRSIWYLKNTKLGVGFGELYKHEKSGLGISANSSITLPTSKASRVQTMLFGLGAGVNASKTFGKAWNMGLTLGAGKSFYRYTNLKLDPATDEQFSTACPTRVTGGFRAAEELGCFLGRVNPNWRVNGGLSGGFAFSEFHSPVLKNLSLSGSMGLATGWSYSVV